MAKPVTPTGDRYIKSRKRRPGKHAKHPNKRFDRKRSRGQG